MHGRVDGPIPEAKLLEFERNAGRNMPVVPAKRRRSVGGDSAASSSPEVPAKAPRRAAGGDSASCSPVVPAKALRSPGEESA